MQITININSIDDQLATDGALLVRIGQAIGGVVVPSVDPQPAAAKATRGAKQAETAAAAAIASPTPAPPVEPSSSAATAAVSAVQSPAVVTGSATETDTPVSEADIIAAANAAVATIGAAGPAKIKTYIGATYTKPDGTPGTIKLTRPEQRGALLADLQKIARGELVLP